MNKSLLVQLSEDTRNIVNGAFARLVHIGGEGIPFRTGIRLDDGYVVSTALGAEDGDEVSVRSPDGTTVTATVRGFDARNGVVLLSTGGGKEVVGWEGEEAYAGMLALTVAFASPEGVESRLDIVRCAGKGYFQTDGLPFPGFSGSAVVSASGKLVGMVVTNAHGNRGNALPYADLVSIVETLKTRGSAKRRVLGLRTHPVTDGLLVVEVVTGSASDKAGLRVGDILTSLGSKKLSDPLSLIDALAQSDGDVVLSVNRGGSAMSVTATPAEKAETVSRARMKSGCCGD